MFRSRAFSGALAANTVAMLALVGNAVFLTQFLQLVLGMSPFKAALWSLVPSVAVGGAAPLATALSQRVDRAYVLGGGFVLGAAGFAVITQVHVESSLAVVLVGAGLLASGLVMVMTLVTEAVVGTVAPERAGSASALMETCSEFGGALGIAVLGSIGTAAYRADLAANLPTGLPDGIGQAAREGLAGATAAAGQVPGQLGGTLLAVARDSFSHSMNVAALVGSVLLVMTAVTVTVMLRGTSGPVPAEESAEEVPVS
jgi:MFS transporter, DHA2 family, multidrug resistance protein